VLVDDYPPLRALLAELLTERECEIVAEAATGRDALDVVDAHCDVVVMDVRMPVMDGIEATRLISARYPSVDIVSFTSDTSELAEQAMLAAGASRQFSKSDAAGLVDHIAGRATRRAA
jgi:DNA-binding NarL/FixJ family response regulator